MLYHNKILNALVKLSHKDPSFVILDTGRLSISASALLSKSNILASALVRKNFKEGDIALLAIRPGINFLVVFYALLMLRAKIAIIDPEMGRDNYFSRMQQLSPKWLFAESKLLLISRNRILRMIIYFFKKNIPRLYLQTGMNVVSIRGRSFSSEQLSLASLTATKESLPLIENNDDYECLIVYTSGTLGTPKGVVHSVNSLTESLYKLEELLRIKDGNILGTHLPHFMLLGIASGYSLKLLNPRASQKKRLIELEEKNINAYFGTPTEIQELVVYCEKYRKTFPKSLRQLFIGSAPVYSSFLSRLIPVLNTHTEVICFYGMTEHLITATITGIEKLKYLGEGDIVGKIVSGVNVNIAPDDEIVVGSPQLFSRYFHEVTGNKMHASGDLGTINPKGELVLLGRKKDMIIRKDFNIYPALYEDTIRKIPGVRDVALCGIFNEKLQDEKVFLVWEGEKVTNKQIKKKLLSGLYSIDKSALPDVIIQMDLPRTGRHQKIDRKLLREQLKTKKH